MHRSLYALFALVLVCLGGCSRSPSFDGSTPVVITYEVSHGEGGRTDYLRVTTDFSEGPASYTRNQVVRWIHRVHPNTKRLFIDRLNAALRKNRMDRIEKRKHPNDADAAFWHLNIHSADQEIDVIVYDLRPLGSKDPFDSTWNDRDFNKMRAFVSDLRLMADLYAIRMPEELIELSTEPNKAPVPTATSVTPAADAQVAPAAAAAQL